MPTSKEYKVKLTVQAQKKTGDLKKTEKELAELSRTAQQTGTQTQKAGVQGAKGLTEIEKAAQKSKEQMRQLKEASDSMVKVGGTLIGIGATLSTAAFFPIASATRFQKAMSEVRAVTTGAEENFVSLTERAAELGRTTKFTATEAAAGMAFLGRAGFDALEVVEGIGPALNLAAAGGLDLATSADIASNILQAMGIAVADLASVTDVLANTANSANTNITQLGEAMKFSAPAAAAAGISIEETSAAIGVLGNNGIQATLAGTALRGILIALSSQTPKATRALNEMGVTISKNRDGSINLTKTFEDLGNAQLNLAQATDIFRRTGATAALALSKQTDQLKVLTAANKESAGVAADTARIMEENLRGSLTLLTSAIDGFLRALGTPLLAPLKTLVDAVTAVVSAMASLASEFPLISGVITGVVGGLGVLGVTLGGAVLSVGLLIKAWLALRAAMTSKFILQAVSVLTGYTGAVGGATAATGGLTTATRVFGVALKSALGWIGLIVAALTAAISIYQAVTKSTQEQIAEAKKQRAEMEKLGKTFDDLTSRYEQAEKGSESQKKAAEALRAELQKIIDTNDELAPAARRAQNAINETTGAIENQGEAIREFQALAFEETLASIRDEMVALAQAQEDAMDPNRFGLAHAAWQQLREFIGETDETVKRFDKDVAAAQARLESRAEATVQGLVDVGRIDPSANIAQFITLMDALGLVTDETRVHFVKAFTDIRQAQLKSQEGVVENAEEAAKKQEAITEAQVRKQINDLSTLSVAYARAYEAARVSPGDEAAQLELTETYRERNEVIKQLSESTRDLAGFAVDTANAEKKAAEDVLATQKARGEVSTAEAKIEELAIEIKYQKRIVEARQATVQAFIDSGAEEVEAGKTAKQVLLDAEELYGDRVKDLKNAQAKAAVKAAEEAAKRQIAVERERVRLSQTILDNELAELESSYDQGLIALEDYLTEREQLTIRKTQLEIEALKKQVQAAAAVDKPILDIQLAVKEAELEGIKQEILASNQEILNDQKTQAIQNELDLLDAKKGMLGTSLEDIRAKQELERQEFKLHTELMELDYVESKLTQDQIDEWRSLRAKKRQQEEEQAEKTALQARLRLVETYAGGAKDIFTGLYELTGKKSKEMFYIAKAAAIAEATMATALAVTEALPNIPLAAIIGAMGLVQIAKIAAQRMEKGGPVVGGSGKKDDVPIMGTGGEFMQPVPTVQYYGEDFMEALRRRLIPRDVVRGLALPDLSPGRGRGGRYQEGGVVGRGLAGGAGAEAPSATNEITMINVTDSRDLDRYLATPSGQDAVVNVISSRSQAIRKIIA